MSSAPSNGFSDGDWQSSYDEGDRELMMIESIDRAGAYKKDLYSEVPDEVAALACWMPMRQKLLTHLLLSTTFQNPTGVWAAPLSRREKDFFAEQCGEITSNWPSLEPYCARAIGTANRFVDPALAELPIPPARVQPAMQDSGAPISGGGFEPASVLSHDPRSTIQFLQYGRSTLTDEQATKLFARLRHA